MRKEAATVRKKTVSPSLMITLESLTIHPEESSDAYIVEMTTMAHETSSCTMKRSLASHL
tara:strand:+ start:988 stop:1167 length:180 start_codon:yes stop_codon:yes gene_type:complete